MAKKQNPPRVEAPEVEPDKEVDLGPPGVAEAVQVPPSILDIADAYERQRLIGIWRAASRLRRINDQWLVWAGELSRGIHPDITLAGSMREAVRACVAVLHRAGLAGENEPREIMRRYPRVDAYLLPVPWWEDSEYSADCLKRMRLICGRDQGHLWELLKDLEADPSVAFIAASQRKATPIDQRVVRGSMVYPLMVKNLAWRSIASKIKNMERPEWKDLSEPIRQNLIKDAQSYADSVGYAMPAKRRRGGRSPKSG